MSLSSAVAVSDMLLRQLSQLSSVSDPVPYPLLQNSMLCRKFRITGMAELKSPPIPKGRRVLTMGLRNNHLSV